MLARMRKNIVIVSDFFLHHRGSGAEGKCERKRQKEIEGYIKAARKNSVGLDV